MIKNEHGYIVVETTGTFIPFVLLVISILSLVNIVTMQARVHNALTQAANTMAMYSYALHSMDATGTLMAIDRKANLAGENIEPVINGIESLSKGNGPGPDNGSRILNSAEAALGDSKATIQNFLSYGISNLQGHATGVLLQPLVGRYLATGDMSGEQYLKSVRVDDIDLSSSVIIDRNGNVKLTANYEIEYTFGALRFPFKPSLRVTQTVVTKAWLGGSGEGYRG